MNSRTFQLPVGFFPALRSALADGRSPSEAARRLRQAGFGVGASIQAALQDRHGEHDAAPNPVTDMPASEFWTALDELFRAWGWGSLRYDRLHAGLAALDSPDWIEAEGAAAAGCHWSEGMFADLLGRVAGGPVAVLEIECRSRGAESCRHLVASEQVLEQVYRDLQAGRSPAEAIARLGQ